MKTDYNDLNEPHLNDRQVSCSVAPNAKCNHATVPIENATENATTNATVNLTTLSMRVLERKQHNQGCNSSATEQLHSNATKQTRVVDTLSKESCTVASCKGSNHETQELRKLIEQVSNNYGGDDKKFLDEYTNDVIASGNIDAALKCFRDLVEQTPPVKNR